MTLLELKNIINRIPERYNDIEVCIDAQTYPNGIVGGTDCSRVKYASKGIDWDADKFILSPYIKLRAVEYKEYINKSIK